MRACDWMNRNLIVRPWRRRPSLFLDVPLLLKPLILLAQPAILLFEEHTARRRGARALLRRGAAPDSQRLGVHAEIRRDLHHITSRLGESHGFAPKLIATRCSSPLLLH